MQDHDTKCDIVTTLLRSVPIERLEDLAAYLYDSMKGKVSHEQVECFLHEMRERPPAQLPSNETVARHLNEMLMEASEKFELPLPPWLVQ